MSVSVQLGGSSAGRTVPLMAVGTAGSLVYAAAYCPVCSSQYRDGVDTCTDCSAALIPLDS